MCIYEYTLYKCCSIKNRGSSTDFIWIWRVTKMLEKIFKKIFDRYSVTTPWGPAATWWPPLRRRPPEDGGCLWHTELNAETKDDNLVLEKSGNVECVGKVWKGGTIIGKVWKLGTIMYWTNKATPLLPLVMDRPCHVPTFLLTVALTWCQWISERKHILFLCFFSGHSKDQNYMKM